MSGDPNGCDGIKIKRGSKLYCLMAGGKESKKVCMQSSCLTVSQGAPSPQTVKAVSSDDSPEARKTASAWVAWQSRQPKSETAGNMVDKHESAWILLVYWQRGN